MKGELDMKEEDNLLKKYGNENPFTVPENYFDKFNNELMEKLPEKAPILPAKEISLWDRVKPWVYMAAMFCGLMLSVRILVGEPQASSKSAQAEESEEMQQDKRLELIIDQAMMDDYELYTYLSEDDINY